MSAEIDRVQSLYAALRRTCNRFALLLLASWLFAAFSYYVSTKSQIDWFGRSGSVMGLAAAASTFRLVGFFQGGLASALHKGLTTTEREIELVLDPPRYYSLCSYFSYLTGIVGTVIWGYGDLLH
jgi:hypothetical protein